MRHNHAWDTCREHGVVLARCRCLQGAQNKNLVNCDKRCPEFDNEKEGE